MSIVTNVLLSVSLREVHTSYPGPPKGLLKNFKASFALVSEIDKWLAERGHGAFGEEIDAGGEKGFEASVFAAAFNSFNTESFLAYLGDLPWRDRQSVQVFVKKQEESRFTLYDLAGPT
jgi:hypothetical protein